jgi:hypothetical protein
MFWLVPRPASLNDSVSDPFAFSDPLAPMKCGLAASAGRAKAAATITAVRTTMVRRIVRNLPLLLIAHMKFGE